MEKPVIERRIKIDAPPGKVWRVFTDPSITKQMAGEYVTDWKAGSSFQWKGSDGKIYTNGTLIEIETGKLLKHTLFNPDDNTSVICVVTYSFENDNTNTILTAREEVLYDMTDQEYEDATQGWEAALHGIKKTAERL